MTQIWYPIDSVLKRRGQADRAVNGRESLVVGTYKPDATTTGLIGGSILTAVHPANDNLSVTTDGTILEDLDIFGRVSVAAANVTIRRCKIRGRSATTSEGLIQATSAACLNLVVEDCLLVPDYPSYWLTGILGHDYTARRCDISRVVDPFGAYNTHSPGAPLKVSILGNYAHDFSYYSPCPYQSDDQTHNDGIQIQGGTGATIIGNNISAYYATDVGTNNQPRPQALSCILFNNNVGNTGKHVIEDNWMGGGYIAVNCGGAPGVDLGRMWRNKFNGDHAAISSGIPHTITLRADQICDAGENTSNQNIFESTGEPVLVRRNG